MTTTMNKIANLNRKSLVPILVLGMVFAMGGFITNQAESESAEEVSNQECWFFDGDGNIIVSTDSHAVATHSHNGNTHLTCKADNVQNSTGDVVKYDDKNNPYAYDAEKNPDGPPEIACRDGFGHATYDWQEVVSPGGNATLQCHYKQ